MVRKGEIRRGSANQNTLFLYYSLYFSSKYSIQMNSSEPVSKFNFIHFLLNCPSCTLYIFFMTQEFLYWTSYEIILSFGWKFLILSGVFFLVVLSFTWLVIVLFWRDCLMWHLEGGWDSVFLSLPHTFKSSWVDALSVWHWFDKYS